MKKILLVATWFPAALICLTLSISLLNSYANVREGTVLASHFAREMLPKDGYHFYASIPEVLGSFDSAITKQDARPEILRLFLKKHDSPMLDYADTLVYTADTYGLDFRLLPAISMCESNLGKKMPSGSHNAWGYAIYTGENSGAQFSDWDDAISVMGKYLYDRFYSHGLTDPIDIGPIYAPPSVETGNSWANCVSTFMEELQ